MNEFKTCDICQERNAESLIDKLRKLDPKANIEVGCQGFCSIGETKNFVIVNGIPVIADTEDEVIEKVKEVMNK